MPAPLPRRRWLSYSLRTLLVLVTAFGICLGCKVYNLFSKDKAQLCPGGACAVIPAPSSGASVAQVAIVAAFIGLVGAVALWVAGNDPHAAALQANATAAQQTPIDPAEAERCKVPEFAKAMGHEEKWKLHNNCK